MRRKRGAKRSVLDAMRGKCRVTVWVDDLNDAEAYDGRDMGEVDEDGVEFRATLRVIVEGIAEDQFGGTDDPVSVLVYDHIMDLADEIRRSKCVTACEFRKYLSSQEIKAKYKV